MRMDLVTHKPARECPQGQPHPRERCGIVEARRQAQRAADEAIRRLHDAESRGDA
ncbi:MAG TPA: hypothetical protein VNK43_08180 [Gemmatimonadales bacterium]|nr:hypothetical protein [Gemmatimonadales bacterium]